MPRSCSSILGMPRWILSCGDCAHLTNESAASDSGEYILNSECEETVGFGFPTDSQPADISSADKRINGSEVASKPSRHQLP